MRPTVEPVIVVQEELPVADDSMPHEQKRHGRLEWSEARVVYRSPLVAFVERPEQDSIFHIRRNCKLLEDVAKDALRTISRQVGEDNDDYLVVQAVAINGLNVQELRLVSVYELDHICHAATGDVFRSEPKSLPLQGLRHEGTHGPIAAEILVRPDHETLDPVCDGAKRSEIAIRELPRSEEHTSELQSRQYLVCRLLLEKKQLTSTSTNPTARVSVRSPPRASPMSETRPATQASDPSPVIGAKIGRSHDWTPSTPLSSLQ